MGLTRAFALLINLFCNSLKKEKKMYTQLTATDLKENKILSKVWDMVCNAHAGQKRKGLNKEAVQPDYVTHPLRAMEIVANALGTPKEVLKEEKNIPVLSAALAHDVIEDTPVNTQEKLVSALIPVMGIQNAKKTASLVQELSNPPEGFPGNTKEEKDAAKKIWQSEHAKKMSMDAKMVKMSDQIANTIDCVDVFMLKQNEKGEYEPTWTATKKVSYVEKAAAVCDACVVGTENATMEQREAFKALLDFEKKAYDYAYLKIENPLLCSREFFNELDNTRKVPSLAFIKQSKTR